MVAEPIPCRIQGHKEEIGLADLMQDLACMCWSSSVPDERVTEIGSETLEN